MWLEGPNDRPTFAVIVQKLKYLIAQVHYVTVDRNSASRDEPTRINVRAYM